MKQSIARQQSRHRDYTPAALRLPPPKPPVVVKRPVEAVAEAAIALPATPEPLVTERTGIPAPQARPMSRQARRKALRAEAKALRREGVPVESAPPIPEPEAAPVPVPVVAASVPEIAETVAAAIPIAAETEAPLPRSRALVAARPRGIALVARRLRAIFRVKQAYVAPPEKPIATQLRTLRDDLAALQHALDRMIDGVAA
jgi:hypothetical protein